MKSIAFAEPDLAELHRQAVEQPLESCAVGFVHRAGNHRDGPRFTVRDVALAPESAYLERSPVRASLAPDFLVAVANKAREMQAGVALLHTHPGLHPLEGFSGTDDDGEVSLRQFFAARAPGHDHFAAVVTQRNVHMRELGGQAAVTVTGVGSGLRHYGSTETIAGDSRYDRQIRAFGREGQVFRTSIFQAERGLLSHDKPVRSGKCVLEECGS